jgi:hypothetical protein
MWPVDQDATATAVERVADQIDAAAVGHVRVGHFVRLATMQWLG